MGLKTRSSRNTVPCRAAFVPCTVGAGSTGESRLRAVGRMPSFPCVPDPDMREKPFRAVRSVLFVTGTVGLEGVGDAFPEFLEELFAMVLTSRFTTCPTPRETDCSPCLTSISPESLRAVCRGAVLAVTRWLPAGCRPAVPDTVSVRELFRASFCSAFLCALTSLGDAPAMPLYSVWAAADRHSIDRTTSIFILIAFIVISLLYG